METLSPMQKKTYDFIVDYIDEHGYSPTFREIGKGLYLASTESVHAHLQGLIKKGYIRYEKGKPRTIVILKGYENV